VIVGDDEGRSSYAPDRGGRRDGRGGRVRTAQRSVEPQRIVETLDAVDDDFECRSHDVADGEDLSDAALDAVLDELDEAARRVPDDEDRVGFCAMRRASLASLRESVETIRTLPPTRDRAEILAVLPPGEALGDRRVWRGVVCAGRLFIPTSRPPGIRKRRDKYCFENAATHPRFFDGTFEYVEGLAQSHFGPWIHHALLADDAGHAIDVTWPEPGLTYVGVVVDRHEVASAVIESRPVRFVTDAESSTR
jgi:hypothetical protein